MKPKSEEVLDNSNRGTTCTLKRKLATCGDRCFFDPTKSSLLSDTIVQNLPSIQCSSKNSCNQNYSKNSIVNNYSNFMKSGLPQHLLFYRNGGWVYYNTDVLSLIQKDFQAKKAITQVSFQGEGLLFDFVHMVVIDAETGSHKHLGWIDEHGHFFPPELSHTFCGSSFHHDPSPGRNAHAFSHSKDASEIKKKLPQYPELSFKRTKISKVPSHHVVEHVVVPGLQEAVGENDVCSISPIQNPHFKSSPGKLVEVVSGGKVYDTVQKLLLMGMGNIIDANDIVGIFNIPSASPFGKTRLKHFQKQLEILSDQRGDANVRYAWLASSRECVEAVMFKGLGNIGKPLYVPVYGCGLHLSPAKCSNLSVAYSEIDENNMVHVVLCRVILGNLEEVLPGSNQSRPSCESYDNGVDDFQNPKHYIVWDLHVDTHILPEYVVSIKVSPSAKGFIFGQRGTSPVSDESVLTSSSCQQKMYPGDITSGDDIQLISNPVDYSQGKARVHRKPPSFPRSPWMPFSMLFAAISTKISSQDMHLISVHYDQYKKQKISRIELIKTLRRIIGDKLLVSTITHLQQKLPSAVHRENQCL